MPIMRYLQGKYEGLTSSDISLLTAGIVYSVDWGNGSKLALIDGYDKWVKVVSEPEVDEPLNESKIVLVRTKYDILNKNY